MKSEVARVVNKAYKRAELKPSLNRSAETFTKGREMQERIANRSQSNAPPPSEKRVKRPAPQPPTKEPTVERFNGLWGQQLSKLTDGQSNELAKKLHDALQPFRERAANTRDATTTPSSEKRVKRPAPQPPTEGPTVERFNRLWGKQLSMLTDEQSKELAKKLHDALQPFRERAANTRDATPTPRQ